MNDASFRAELLKELRLVRLALEALAAGHEPPAPEPEQEPMPCSHPMDSRIDFGTTEGKPDWQCRDCGFRTTQP